MRFYGLISSVLLLPLFAGIWQLYNRYHIVDNYWGNWNFYWDNWNYYLGFFIIYFAIFGGYISVDRNKLRIFRLFWFIHKKNTIELDEIKKVYIRNGGQTTGASVSIEFIDKNEKSIGGLLCQMLNFELRRLKKRLEELGIDVYVDEIRGNKI